jgi:hypothetical protein
MNKKLILPFLSALCLSSAVGASPPEKKEDEKKSDPVHPKTEEAVRKAHKSVKGYGPEGLQVHLSASKIDQSKSGPIHPDTEENARMALEAIRSIALEGLRVHPEEFKKGAKVEPATEKPAKDTVMVEALPGGLQPRVLAHKTFSADNEIFAGFYRDGWDEVISIHDAKTGKQIKRIVGHGDELRELKFTPDGKLLASRCINSDRKGWALWDVATGKLILRLPVPSKGGG